MEQVGLSILVIATEVYLQTRVASNIGFYVFFLSYNRFNQGALMLLLQLWP
jgi:hypothetical protein